MYEVKLANFLRRIDMIVDRVDDEDTRWKISPEEGIDQIRGVIKDAFKLLDRVEHSKT